MTDLQVSLILVGIVVVVGVVIFNKLQTNNQGGDAAPSDAPADEGRIEPSLGVAVAEDAEQAVSVPKSPPANVVQQPVERAAEVAQPLVPGIGAVIDPLIDCVVPIALDGAVGGERVLGLIAPLRRTGLKPVHVEGRAVSTGEWEAVRAGGRYAELQVAVQLANRSGALNALEFSEFVGATQQLAEGLEASVDFPDMNETVARARELDAFSAQCDAQLGINVISDGAPWSAAYVQSVVGQDGLVLSRDGARFTRYDGKIDSVTEPGAAVQRPMFTLQFANTNFLRDDLTLKVGERIVLLLDVPNAPQAMAPFRSMWEYAETLAARLGATVVDDNMSPLSAAATDVIEQQLENLYRRLEQHGLPAGSEVSRRLFSI